MTLRVNDKGAVEFNKDWSFEKISSTYVKGQEKKFLSSATDLVQDLFVSDNLKKCYDRVKRKRG